MHIEKLSLEETGCFTSVFLDYLKQDPKLKDFYGLFPHKGNFLQQIQQKQFSTQSRITLTQTLNQQYKGFNLHHAVKNNLNTLEKNTAFTITTGHQLNLCTGPLYLIYKIVTIINACKELKQVYPDFDFIPVFWMASEDHDFEEICYFNLFGKKFIWETQQKGAVGRFSTTEIKPILDSLAEKPTIFEKAYLQQATLSAAVRYYLNELFGSEGLVILDGDQAELKQSLIPVIQEDLLHENITNAVSETSATLAKKGYKTQAHPREINFFYLDQGIRERIIRKGTSFHINNTNIVFTRSQILEISQSHPEKFSPNVILRPVYQEMVLPNLAYIGGPGEIAYWLQLKTTFELLKITFPILMPRNFALIINKTNYKKFSKLNMGIADLFLDLAQLKIKYTKDHTDKNLDLNKEKESLTQIYNSIIVKSKQIDKSLEGFIGSELTKARKSIDQIEKRLVKSEEKNQETTLKQLEGIKEKLFPNGGLQERHDNFLNFYLNDPDFIHKLMHSIAAFDFSFNVIIENE
jgi:bacillithiol synthase